MRYDFKSNILTIYKNITIMLLIITLFAGLYRSYLKLVLSAESASDKYLVDWISVIGRLIYIQRQVERI